MKCQMPRLCLLAMAMSVQGHAQGNPPSTQALFPPANPSKVGEAERFDLEAKRYFIQFKYDEMFIQTLRDVAKRANDPKTTEFVNCIISNLPAEKFGTTLREILRKFMTSAELTEINNFYESALGQKILTLGRAGQNELGVLSKLSEEENMQVLEIQKKPFFASYSRFSSNYSHDEQFIALIKSAKESCSHPVQAPTK